METGVYYQIQSLEQNHWWYRGMFALARDELRRCLGPNPAAKKRVILDIGCGSGCWTKKMREYGNVIALDNSMEALDMCRDKHLTNLVECSADSLPFADGSCDLITALGLIEHLDNDAALCGEAMRVLKPAGYGIFLTSAFASLWSEHDAAAHHKRRYTARQLKRIMGEAGFEIVKMSYVNFFMFLPIILIRAMRRLTGRKKTPLTASPDLFMPPGLINSLLYGLLRMETLLLRWVSLPFGVSLIAVVRKKQQYYN